VTDRDLIKGCIRENRVCQREVFRRYAGKMMAVCLRYTRNRMEAEDVLQEAFIQVFDHLGDFEFKGSLEGWIRRIVVNAALQQYRQRSRREEAESPDHLEAFALEPSIYAHLHEKELLALIAQLPDGYKMVFNLHAIEGYSHREIGELLGIEESTSRSQLVKARKLLQAKIMDMQKIAV